MSSKKKRQEITKTKERVSRPRKYKVVMYNDDFTPMEFVIFILENIFNRSAAEATRIMLKIHNQGSGIAGVYSKEIATTKCDKSIQIARSSGYPLMLEVEPE